MRRFASFNRYVYVFMWNVSVSTDFVKQQTIVDNRAI